MGAIVHLMSAKIHKHFHCLAKTFFLLLFTTSESNVKYLLKKLEPNLDIEIWGISISIMYKYKHTLQPTLSFFISMS